MSMWGHINVCTYIHTYVHAFVHLCALHHAGSPQDLFVRLQALRLSSSALLKLLALVNMDPLQFLSPC